MKNELLQKMDMVLAALNSISVSGKSNLANLSGSIAVLEDLYKSLRICEISKNDNHGSSD